jgi:hypothetical protein
VGLGRESCIPPGPRLGLLNVSHPSASNGHVWILAEQNAVDAIVRTLGFIHASLCRAVLRSLPHDGTTTGPLTGARPPMGGRATVERLLGRALPAHRSERATVLVGRRVTWRTMAGPELAAVSGGSRSTHAVSGSIHSRW